MKLNLQQKYGFSGKIIRPEAAKRAKLHDSKKGDPPVSFSNI